MAKKLRLWCVKKGGAVMKAPDGTKYWSKKTQAKKARNELQGKTPEEEKRDHMSAWMYRVSPGPDHWRSWYVDR